jgi:hypothetical protein
MCAFANTIVDPAMYRIWFRLLTIGYVVPIPFLVLDLCLGKPEWFAPSGAITLFLVAVVQFKQLGLLQNKHITNAERASKQESIQLLSDDYRRLELRSFWSALFGTGIWAYGDKLVKVLLAAMPA